MGYRPGEERIEHVASLRLVSRIGVQSEGDGAG
jgi:hypothetical protein